jgi:putative peptidoglycan lipid II flippase
MIGRLFTKESHTIAGAALVIGVSSVVSRLLGLARDRLLVQRFPLDDLDAYFAAFQIPSFLFALLVLGTLSASFIPVFTDYLAKGRREEAWRVTNAIMGIALFVMGLACLGLIFTAPMLARFVAPGFEGEKLALTVKLTRVMMLSPLLFAVSAVLSSVLNSFKQFLTVALAPVLYNGAIIFGLLFLSVPFGIAGVAYGAILGATLHILIQIPAVAALGFRFRPSLEVRHAGVREIGRLFLPRVFGIDISQVSQLIGSVVGTTIGVGAVSVFNLSMNIGQVPTGIIAIPFAIAAFPALAEAAAKGERATFIRVFASTFRQILFFLIPISALAYILRSQVTRVVIGGAGMDAEAFALTTASFGLFSLSICLQGLAPLLARSFYSLKNTLVPVIASGASVVVYLAAIFLCLKSPFGADALTLLGRMIGATTADIRELALPASYLLASLTQVIVLLVTLRRRHGRIGGAGLLRAFLKIACGTAAAVAAGVMAARKSEAFFGFTGQASYGQPFMSVFFQAALVTAAAALAYFVVLKLLKSEELDSIAGSFKRKMMNVEKPVAVSDTQGM